MSDAKKNAEGLEKLLFQIFMSYSSFGSKQKANYLKLQKFLQLCSEAQIVDPQASPYELQLLFQSASKGPNMDFQNFLSSTTKLAELKFPQEFRSSPQTAFSKLIKEHLVPLQQKLKQNTTFSEEDFRASEESKLILSSVDKGLRSVYSKYFPWELSGKLHYEEAYNRSQQALEQVLKELDVYPSLVNKTRIQELWKQLVIMQNSSFEPAKSLVLNDQGTYLTYSKFILILYLCALYGYENSQVSTNSPSEKVLIMLERMELARPKGGSSLLPPTEVVQGVLESQQGLDISIDTQSMDGDISRLSLEPEGVSAVEEYLLRLQKIFQVYASYADALNTKGLASSSLQKLLRDCGLLGETRATENLEQSICKKGDETPLITSVEIDIIFSRLVAVKKKAKAANASVIDFQQFLKALEIIARRVFQEEPIAQALQKLLEDYVLKLELVLCKDRLVFSDQIKERMDMFKEDSMIEAMSIVHRSVLYFYRHYSDQQGYMTFDNFTRFCRDFELFPDVVSKTRLVRYFGTLAGVSDPDASRMSSIDDKEAIDQHLFVEILAIISQDLVYDEPQPDCVEKLCFLMERMSQSKGPSKVLRALGHNRSSHGEIHDLLTLMKSKYPHILDHSPKKKPSFQDLASLVEI